MCSNRLQLNGDKTEFIWYTTYQAKMFNSVLAWYSQRQTSPCNFVTMRTHIYNVLSPCYGSLRQTRTKPAPAICP